VPPPKHKSSSTSSAASQREAGMAPRRSTTAAGLAGLTTIDYACVVVDRSPLNSLYCGGEPKNHPADRLCSISREPARSRPTPPRSRHPPSPCDRRYAEALFARIDRDGSGGISKDELQARVVSPPSPAPVGDGTVTPGNRRKNCAISRAAGVPPAARRRRALGRAAHREHVQARGYGRGRPDRRPRGNQPPRQ
jgi:hypothetical protein